MDSREKLEVPVDVMWALKEVRDEGKFNMYSSNEVVVRMSQLGHHKEANWMIDEGYLERTGTPRVDTNKYMTALIEMGRSRAIIDNLSRK